MAYLLFVFVGHVLSGFLLDGLENLRQCHNLVRRGLVLLLAVTSVALAWEMNHPGSEVVVVVRAEMIRLVIYFLGRGFTGRWRDELPGIQREQNKFKQVNL